MRWTVHGERSLYESDWMSLRLVDVELPDGERFEHHVLHVPHQAAATVVHDHQRGVLLLWRHRFIADRWGWEVPGGQIDAGETPGQAAAREVLEETGWRPGPVRKLGEFEPMAGQVRQTFHVFVAEGATYEREPDGIEVERVEWFPPDRVRELIARGEIRDGLSLAGLLWFFSLEPGR